MDLRHPRGLKEEPMIKLPTSSRHSFHRFTVVCHHFSTGYQSQLSHSSSRIMTSSEASPSPAISFAQAKSLRQSYATTLESFTSSASTNFQVLHSFIGTTSLPSPSHTSPATNVKTLYILDSSFNPPTRAHLTLARNAVLYDTAGGHPARFLFLLATQNADKPSKPAAFADRLVMMTLVASRLARELASHDRKGSSTAEISVDVGVTKKPFFVDKAMAIDDSGVYGNGSAQQVHVTGYDTIIRIFNAKYYAREEGLRALQPFLSKHRLRVCYRASGGGEEERREQEKYVEQIGDGSREAEGVRKEWRDMIELVDDAAEAAGVSSTEARKAAVEERKADVEAILGKEVTEYVLGQGLYQTQDDVNKDGIKPEA